MVGVRLQVGLVDPLRDALRVVTQSEITSSSGDPALRRLALVLRRSALGLLCFTVLVAAAVYGLAAGRASTYRSESIIELTDAVAVGITSTGQRRGDARVEIEAQRRVLESRTVLDLLRARTGVGDDIVSVSTSNPEDTPVIVVAVAATTPESAVVAADEVIDIYVEQRLQSEIDRLESELGPLRDQRIEQQELVQSIVDELAVARVTGTADEISVLENRGASALSRLNEYDIAVQEREFFQETVEGRVRVVESARSAVDTATSAATQAIQFGLLALLLGVGGVVVTSRVRGRLLLLDEVRAVAGTGVPILATVPRFGAKHRRGAASLVVASTTAPREAESFRYTRSAIEVAASGLSPLSVLITSSKANEGKTVTSSNLALASALAARSTALLDGDLLNSSVQGLFDTGDRTNAFRGLLSGEIDPKTQSWHQVGEGPNPLDVLVAAKNEEVTQRVELSVDTVAPVLRNLKKLWDVVVVDGPPILAVSDAMILARSVDMTVLIVRIGRTTRRDLETAITQLRQGGVAVGGIIVTQTRERGESYYGHDYDYAVKS